MTATAHPDRHEHAASIGAAVRTTREGLRLDQETTALLAGVSTRFLRALEHGKPTVQLDKLLAVLDVLGLELRIGRRGA
ncbi:MAG TPA: helix-turn-helix domain-containing protein [Nitriliruptorales bacterium]